MSPLTILGLTNGVEYTFRVTARNANGVGLPSPPTSNVTPLGAPGAPFDAVGTAGSDAVTVSFTPPLYDGGAAIEGYVSNNYIPFICLSFVVCYLFLFFYGLIHTTPLYDGGAAIEGYLSAVFFCFVSLRIVCSICCYNFIYI
jgi:hypothetical protein